MYLFVTECENTILSFIIINLSTFRYFCIGIFWNAYTGERNKNLQFNASYFISQLL